MSANLVSTGESQPEKPSLEFVLEQFLQEGNISEHEKNELLEILNLSLENQERIEFDHKFRYDSSYKLYKIHSLLFEEGKMRPQYQHLESLFPRVSNFSLSPLRKETHYRVEETFVPVIQTSVPAEKVEQQKPKKGLLKKSAFAAVAAAGMVAGFDHAHRSKTIEQQWTDAVASSDADSMVSLYKKQIAKDPAQYHHFTLGILNALGEQQKEQFRVRPKKEWPIFDFLPTVNPQVALENESPISIEETQAIALRREKIAFDAIANAENEGKMSLALQYYLAAFQSMKETHQVTLDRYETFFQSWKTCEEAEKRLSPSPQKERAPLRSQYEYCQSFESAISASIQTEGTGKKRSQTAEERERTHARFDEYCKNLEEHHINWRGDWEEEIAKAIPTPGNNTVAGTGK